MNNECLFVQVCKLDTLRRAWEAVRGGRTLAERRRGAGVDGVSIADWETDWVERVRSLRSALSQGTYRAAPLLRFDMPHPKAGHAPRRLGIPTVTDRVVQWAVKSVIEPLWEKEFLSCNHGFRPQRSVFTAVAQVLWHHAQGRSWVLNADIAACFDTLEHPRLLDQLSLFADKRLLELISQWLALGTEHANIGIAQGSPLSPLLANIYLHPFDVALVETGWALVRYADDFVVLCETLSKAQQALVKAAYDLAALGLSLNGDKTTIVPFGPDFEFLGAQFSED